VTRGELDEVLSGLSRAHIATVGPDGTPHASVVAFAPLDGALWFATDPRSGKAQAMRANPQVAIMFEGNGAEVYVWGDVELLGDPETRRRLWEEAPMPYDKAAFFGDPYNERVVWGRVTPRRATVVRMGPNGLGRERWSAAG